MGQEWDVGWAVNVTFDPHSHLMPCPVPAPGGPSHPVPRQPPPQPLPSHHLPSILFTAARQFFEKLKLGHVTCLVSLATLRVNPSASSTPKAHAVQPATPWFPPLGITFKPPSPAFQLEQRIPSPAFTLCLRLPFRQPCPSFLSFQPLLRYRSPGSPVLHPSLCHVLPSQTASASDVTLWLRCYLVTAVCLLEGLLPPLVPTGVPGT